MIYIFKNNQLIWSGDSRIVIDVPLYSYIYNVRYKQWSRRYQRQPIRPLQDKHVPKELKMLCILLNIPI